MINVNITGKTVLIILAGMLTAVNALSQPLITKRIKESHPVVYLAGGHTSTAIAVERKWQNGFCSLQIKNTGGVGLRVSEVVIFSANRQFAGTTPLYAEGFQMLSQYTGTLGNVEKIGSYDDYAHYKLPQPAGYKTVYNMLVLHGEDGNETLMGFNSSFRFIGKFYLSYDTIKVVMDLDNTLIHPGEIIRLEEFSLLTAKDVHKLTTLFAARINHFHPRLNHTPIPAGWCSWYCFGPGVTPENIKDNLGYIKKNIPQLQYIQLDDGYQAHMGDWLQTGPAFGTTIKTLLRQIKESGLKPAIWVAPFICDSNSTIFKQHPDWLIHDTMGKPLRSDKVSFGGWRLAPWYVLDGTNPKVQQHLTTVFRVMNQEWGCTYFKLDANFWGAIQGGVYYDKNATRVTAYRNGMKAIIAGAGKAFILGCNHPLWPSLGLINGSRSSNDIFRSWKNFVTTGEENINRIWQNGQLWWNDPDCILLTGQLTDDEFMYHASLLFSTGGMMLSGDDLTTIPAQRLAILKKMLPPSGIVTHYNTGHDIGWMKTSTGYYLVILNKENEPRKISVPLSHAYDVINYWTGEQKGIQTNTFSADVLPPHSGCVYKLIQTKK